MFDCLKADRLSAPCVASDGTVFVGLVRSSGTVHAVTAIRSGIVLYEVGVTFASVCIIIYYNFDSQANTVPTVAIAQIESNLVLFVGTSYGLTAFNAQTGATLWQYSTGDTVRIAFKFI